MIRNYDDVFFLFRNSNSIILKIPFGKSADFSPHFEINNFNEI